MPALVVAVDPVRGHGGVVADILRPEPQPDLVVGGLHRVTAVADVPANLGVGGVDVGGEGVGGVCC